MGYVEDNLLPGESIVYKTNQHISTFAGSMIASIALTSPIAVFNIWLYLSACTLVLLFFYLAYKSREFVITNMRILSVSGLIKLTTNEMLLQKVESVSAEQDILEKLFSIGTVRIRGTGGYEIVFKRVPHFREFHQKIIEVLEGRKGKEDR